MLDEAVQATDRGGDVVVEDRLDSAQNVVLRPSFRWSQLQLDAELLRLTCAACSRSSTSPTATALRRRRRDHPEHAAGRITAFYCDPFVPPEDGLPPQEAEPNPNLRERAGCDGCHSELEPAAAHRGRWRSGGTHGLLREETMSFEEPRANCQCGEGTDTPNCNLTCRTYHVTADNSHPDTYAEYGGLPLAAAYLEGDELDNVEMGPSNLLQSPAQRRVLAQCMVKTLAEHLLGRPMESDDLPWIEDHTEVLEADGYRFGAMVQCMVEDERYRSID